MNDNERKAGTAEANASAATGTTSAEEYLARLKRDPAVWDAIKQKARSALDAAQSKDNGYSARELLLFAFADYTEDGDMPDVPMDVSIKAADMVIREVQRESEEHFERYLYSHRSVLSGIVNDAIDACMEWVKKSLKVEFSTISYAACTPKSNAAAIDFSAVAKYVFQVNRADAIEKLFGKKEGDYDINKFVSDKFVSDLNILLDQDEYDQDDIRAAARGIQAQAALIPHEEISDAFSTAIHDVGLVYGGDYYG